MSWRHFIYGFDNFDFQSKKHLESTGNLRRAGVLFGIGKYCLVLVSIVKVFSGIVRYCFVFPGIAPAEEKRNFTKNYQQL